MSDSYVVPGSRFEQVVDKLAESTRRVAELEATASNVLEQVRAYAREQQARLDALTDDNGPVFNGQRGRVDAANTAYALCAALVVHPPEEVIDNG